MSDFDEVRKIEVVDEDGNDCDLYVLSQTRIAGVNYILVSEEMPEDGEGDDDEEVPIFIFKEAPDDDDEDSIRYEAIDDEKEMEIVTKVFAEMLDDVDFGI